MPTIIPNDSKNIHETHDIDTNSTILAFAFSGSFKDQLEMICNDKTGYDDIPVIKDLYAAEVTFTDYAICRFLKSIKEMGLMENTIVIFTTDHGTHLGEEGCVQKTSALLNR